MPEQAFDQEKFDTLQGKVFADVGGAMGVLISYLGDQAGAYAALEAAGQSTAEQLAEKSGLDARYLREWLSSNAAFGYVDYDPDTEAFSLSPEQAALFAHEGTPTCMQGFFESMVSQYAGYETAVDVFKTGRGRPWSEHQSCCFSGTDRFFRPGYAYSLVDHWIPSLDGVKAKLDRGAKIVDIGCGFGSSSILMAQSFPNSTVIGYDFHEPSIIAAREKAKRAGVTNVEFHVAAAKDYPGTDFDFACVFDALHDMGDPVGAADHIKRSLKPDGTFMIVEPMAGDTLSDNLHLLGGIFYGYSTLMCVPASKSQEVGLALGAQAGEQRIADVLRSAGFSRVSRATETPMNIILEARS